MRNTLGRTRGRRAVVSQARRERADRERFVESLFSPVNLERKAIATLSPADIQDGRDMLARLDDMPAVTSTDSQLQGLRLGAKLRALYLSGGDLGALRRAVDIAMGDHRDLHQESEYPGPGWPGITAVDSNDSRSGFDRFIDWMEH
jgi:hypothetical protein